MAVETKSAALEKLKQVASLSIGGLCLSILCAACSGSAPASPTAPTPPVSTPAPTTPAQPTPRANLVAVDAIEFLACINGLCTFRGTIRNTGNACAVNISGESWIVSAQGQEVARARWTALPGTVIPPGEGVYYFGEGMPQAVLNHLDGRYFASFIFDSREC